MFNRNIMLMFCASLLGVCDLGGADLVVTAKDPAKLYANCVDGLRIAYRQSLLDAETRCLNKSKDPSGASCDPGGLDDDGFETSFSQSQANQIQKCWSQAYADQKSKTTDLLQDHANSGEFAQAHAASSAPLPPKRPADLGGKSATPSAAKTAKTNAPSKANDSGNGQPAAPADNTDQIQAQADADVAACSSSRAQAQKCCGNPLSCASTADQNQYAALQRAVNAGPQVGQSLTDYCSQISQVSSQSGRLNSALAGICAGNQSSCQSTCGGLVRKYESLLNNCDGCSAQSIYEEALNSISSGNDSCQQLKASANTLALQSISAGGSQARGSICEQAALSQDGGSSDSSGVGMPAIPNAGPTAAYNAASVTAPATDPYGCQLNPNSTACRTLAAQPGLQAASATAEKVGFQSQDRARATNPDFNVGSTADATVGAHPNYGEPTNPKPEKSATIPNGGGSGFPNVGSNSTANLPRSASASAGFQMPAGSKADIFHGLRSGGYSSGSTYAMANNHSGEQILPSSYGGGRGPSANSRWLGMDLKQFLPGGSRDPNRHLAGFTSGAQILGKGEDLFKRVSNKMEEKCKLGLLFECWP